MADDVQRPTGQIDSLREFIVIRPLRRHLLELAASEPVARPGVGECARLHLGPLLGAARGQEPREPVGPTVFPMLRPEGRCPQDRLGQASLLAPAARHRAAISPPAASIRASRSNGPRSPAAATTSAMSSRVFLAGRAAGSGGSSSCSFSVTRTPRARPRGSTPTRARSGIRTHTPRRTGAFEAPASTIPPSGRHGAGA
jgi:hypothetical protein